jgi:hypothetical protein
MQFPSDDCSFLMNIKIMERYKSLKTEMIEPIILNKLGKVSDDEWDDENYESSFDNFSALLRVS